jgi:preprotein translocase subunit SecF
MFKKALTAALAALLINLAAAGNARAVVAQDAAAAVAKVKEAVAKIGTGPSALAEVKLKNRTKLKGYVAEASEEYFTVVGSDGKATRAAYAEVESVKAVKPKSGRKKFDEHGLIGLVLIGGIIIITCIYVGQTK